MAKFEKSVKCELNSLSSDVNNLRSEYEMIAGLNSELNKLKYNNNNNNNNNEFFIYTVKKSHHQSWY